MAKTTSVEGRYPDADEFDEALFTRIQEMTLPDGKAMDVPWFKRNVWPVTHSYEIPREKV